MSSFTTIEELQQEVARLTIELQREREARLALEDECDLLAEENERLRGLQAKFHVPSTITHAHTASASASASVCASASVTVSERDAEKEDCEDLSSSLAAVELDVFVAGERNEHVHTLVRRVDDACSGKNVTATAIFAVSDAQREALCMGDLVFCGGVDGLLRGLDLETGVEMLRERVSAPVLAIACSATHVAAGMMDGSLLVMPMLNPDEARVLNSFKDHNKYLVALQWCSEGEFLASAGHDKTVNIYRKNSLGEVEKYKSVQFTFTPESVCFTKHSDDQPLELIIGLRGVPYLVYLNVHTFEQRQVSLNANEWDTHVSLTPLYLSLSPCGKYLCVATDKHFHLILRVGTNKRVRTLSGHACGDYGKPVAVWDHTGKFIYSNSEEDSGLFVFSLATERVTERLSGHKGIVRALAAHPHKPIVSTASYDKSLGIWKN